jgi:hypothetical protein
MAGRTLGSRLHLEPFTPDRAAADGDRQAVLLALANRYLRDSWTQFLFTLPSAVAVVNALLAGVTVGLTRPVQGWGRGPRGRGRGPSGRRRPARWRR